MICWNVWVARGNPLKPGSVSGVSWHHMCYIISDNIPRCYDYRQPLVTPHFGGIFTTCELRACEGRGNKTQEECVIISWVGGNTKKNTEGMSN